MFTDTAEWINKLMDFKIAAKNKNTETIMCMAKELHKGKSIFYDEIINSITHEEFSYMPVKPKTTIAWVLWHLMRIEDMISNMLINGTDQIFNNDWKKLMNSNITDTGNALTKKEIRMFSNELNLEGVLEYRKAVEKRTVEILDNINKNLSDKPLASDLDKIVKAGGLVSHKDSIWLIKYWGGRTIAGLLSVPVTGHHLMHLDSCRKIKEIYAAI